MVLKKVLAFYNNEGYMPTLDGKTYKSSFSGFLDGMSESNRIKNLENKVRELSVDIENKDRTIVSLRKSLKKLRKQMKESASVTYCSPKSGRIKLVK